MPAICQVMAPRKVGVLFDAASSGINLTASQYSLSGSWPHTVGSSSKEIVLVAVAVGSGGPFGMSSLTVTSNLGGTYTQMAALSINGSLGYLAVFACTNPVAGINTLTVSGSSNGNWINTGYAGSVSYHNVASIGTPVTQTSTSGALSDAVSSATGDTAVVVAAFSSAFTGFNGTQRVSANAGATQGVAYLMIGDAPGASTVGFTTTSTSHTVGAIALDLAYLPKVSASVITNTNVPAGTAVPAATTGCYVTLIGAGDNGGHGPGSGTNASGGAGGGGGSLVSRTFIPVASLGSTYSVTRGVSAASASIFTSGSITLTAGGGSGSTGGTATASGITGITLVNGSNGGGGSAGGGSNTAGAGSGGGGGAGINSNGAWVTGPGGGGSTTGGGAGGGGNGGAGAASSTDGFGGGGGAGSGFSSGTANTAYSGGAGGAPGGGGGGGCATNTSAGGGNGGAFAPGFTKIEWV